MKKATSILPAPREDMIYKIAQPHAKQHQSKRQYQLSARRFSVTRPVSPAIAATNCSTSWRTEIQNR